MDSGQREAVRLATRFYASGSGSDLRCVVTGQDEPQWHHLDEAAPRRWHFTNIIPLNGGLNQILDKRRFQHLTPDLHPDHLNLVALSHYRHGRFAYGYACDRLASFLMWPHRGDIPRDWNLDATRSLEFAAYALLQLRALSALPLATDTLTRSILRTLQSVPHVSRRAAARVVVEMESYYRNYGVFDRAVGCCDLVERLLRDETWPPGDRARVVQHKGIALGAMGRAEEGEQLLDRAKDEVATSGGYTDGHATDALWRSRLILNTARPDLDTCANLIRTVYRERDAGHVGEWTFAETVWTDAEINYRRGRVQDGHDLLLQGRQLFYGAGIVPAATLPLKITGQFRERYPRALYVLPRTPAALRSFGRIAGRILAVVEARLRERQLTG